MPTPQTEAARLLTKIVRERLVIVESDLLNAQNAAGTDDTNLALGALHGLEERLAGVIALIGAVRITLNTSL